MLQNRATCRLRERCVPRTFQERLLCAIEHSDLTTEQIAQAAHVRYSRLRDYCSNPERRIPAVILAEVVRVTGRVDLFEALLAPLGYQLRRTDSAGPLEPLPSSCLDVQEAVGRLSGQVKKATLDGRISEDERAQLRECVRAIRRELADVEASLESPRALELVR
jgi:hypothetical protein